MSKLGRILYPLVTVFLIVISLGVLLGCGSNADTVNKNLGKKCEQFQCQRRIIAINAITDKVILDAEGRCSIEKNKALSMGSQETLELICKYGPDNYKKSFVGLSDNVTWTSVQLNQLDVNEYRTKFIFRPQSLVPDLDLVTGTAP